MKRWNTGLERLTVWNELDIPYSLPPADNDTNPLEQRYIPFTCANG